MKGLLKNVGCSIPIIIYVGLLVFSVFTMLSSCSEKKVSEVDDSYYEGYSDGYYDGVEKAKQYIAFAVEDDLYSIAWDIEDEYGMLPEDALNVLTNYIDAPDEVSEQELTDAIYAIRDYYYTANDIINGIEDYCID